jgi:hypothetical protein
MSYHGHCFIEKNGDHLPPVLLPTVEDAWTWAFHPLRQVFPEIRITGTDNEDTLIHVVEGQLRWPTTKEMNLTQEQVDRMVAFLKTGRPLSEIGHDDVQEE